MPRAAIVDEIHLTVRVPARLPDELTQAVRRTLLGTAFMVRLRQAIRTVFRANPELASARVTLTR